WWLQVSHTDFWLRLPTALLGTAVIPLTYGLGQRLLGERAGLLAALFCALTSYQVYYSRYPRSYMLLTLLAVAAALSLYGALHQRRWRHWALHGAAVVLALYTHPYAFFLLPALWGFALLWSLRNRIRTLVPVARRDPRPDVDPQPPEKREDLFSGDTPKFPRQRATALWHSRPGGHEPTDSERTLVPLFVTAGLALSAYLPWLSVSWAQWGGVSQGADAWIEPVTLDTLKTIYDWLWFKTRLDYNPPVDLLLRGGRYLFSALLLATWWWGRRRWETWYTAALTLVPIALPLTFSIVAVPLLDPRYLVVASPFLAVWVGQAVAASGMGVAGLLRGRLPEAGRRFAPPVLTLLLVLMSLPPLWSLYFDPAFASPDERAANAWLHERYTEGDLLLHLDYQSYLPALWYDHQRTAMGLPAPAHSHPAPCTWESLPDAWCDASPYRRTYVNLDLQPLAEALKGERHIWLTTLDNHNKPAEAAQASQRVEQLMAGRYTFRPAAAFLGVQLFELTAR
ncbi:MAG: glycosyltransferase family 39 protein, partial [Chloroflexota bacterium]